MAEHPAVEAARLTNDGGNLGLGELLDACHGRAQHRRLTAHDLDHVRPVPDVRSYGPHELDLTVRLAAEVSSVATRDGDCQPGSEEARASYEALRNRIAQDQVQGCWRAGAARRRDAGQEGASGHSCGTQDAPLVRLRGELDEAVDGERIDGVVSVAIDQSRHQGPSTTLDDGLLG